MTIINAMELRELIRKLRLRKGWSQADLAREAKVSSGTIGTIEAENRMPYMRTLRKIADALGVTVEYILRETGQLGPPSEEEQEEITALTSRIRELDERDRRVVQRLIDELLEEEKREHKRKG